MLLLNAIYETPIRLLWVSLIMLRVDVINMHFYDHMIIHLFSPFRCWKAIKWHLKCVFPLVITFSLVFLVWVHVYNFFFLFFFFLEMMTLYDYLIWVQLYLLIFFFCLLIFVGLEDTKAILCKILPFDIFGI